MGSGVTAKVLFEYIAQQEDELTICMGDIITNVEQEDGGWWKGEVNGKSGMFPENFVSIVKSNSAGNTESSFKAEVKFDYDPEQSDEIKLIKGTIIDVIATPDEGWWKGRYEGKEGLFPSNFVEVVESPKSADPASKPVPIPAAENTKQAEMESKPPTQSQKGPSKIANLLGMIKPEDLSRNNLKKVNNTSNKKVDEVDSDVGNQNDVLKPTQLVPPMHVDHEKEKQKMTPNSAVPGGAKPLQYARAIFDYEPELPDELQLKVGDRITVIDSELTFEGWMRGEVNGAVGIFPDNFVELLPADGTERPADEGATHGNQKEDLIPRPTMPTKEASPKPPSQGFVKAGGMVPAKSPIQNELAEIFSKKSASPSPKVAAKAPPPPIPSSKPALPGTKPKPPAPHSKPSSKLPFMPKPDNKPPVPSDSKPLKENVKTSPKSESKFPGNVLKPVLGKNEVQPPPTNSSDVTGEKKKVIPVDNRSLSIEEVKFPTVNEDDIQPLQKTSSVSLKERAPSVESQGRSRSFAYNEASSAASNKFPIPRSGSLDRGDNELEEYGKETMNGHTKLTGKPSIQLDDVRPTDPLKHIERVKPPSKSPPSKFKDKHPLEDFSAKTVDNSKEVNELKLQVAELQTKMDDMAEMFKNLVIQLTDDLSTERKLRSNLQIEVETLSKKLKIFLDKPGL